MFYTLGCPFGALCAHFFLYFTIRNDPTCCLILLPAPFLQRASCIVFYDTKCSDVLFYLVFWRILLFCRALRASCTVIYDTKCFFVWLCTVFYALFCSFGPFARVLYCNLRYKMLLCVVLHRVGNAPSCGFTLCFAHFAVLSGPLRASGTVIYYTKCYFVLFYTVFYALFCFFWLSARFVL